MAWVLPQIVLAAPPHSQIALVSPWIRDVPLDLPLPLRNRSSHLSTLLRHAQEHSGLRVLLVCREKDQYVQGILRRLAASPQVDLILRPTLHAKAIITPQFILSGSGNLLWTSLYRNEETLRLDHNEWPDIRQAMRQSLGVMP